MPEVPEHLARATRDRQAAAEARVRDALRRLDRNGEAISFVAVAKAATVARSWLYRQSELRAQIEGLRSDPPVLRRVPAAQRSSADSLRRQVEALRQEASRLRHENQALRDQLAHKLGSDRQAALGGGHLR